MSHHEERALLPGDEDYSGSFDDALGAEIAAALAPFAPDPEEFEAGVRERIEGGAQQPAQLSLWVRNAAAFFPPILLPRGMAELGLSGGSLALKQGGWKLLPGLIALPVIMLAGAIASFVLVLRRAEIGPQQRTDLDDTRETMRHWGSILFGAIGALFLVELGATFVGGPELVKDIAVGVLSVSMLSMITIVGALSRAGLASRAMVGQICASVLAFLIFVEGPMTQGLWRGRHGDGTWDWLAPLLVMGAGAFYCAYLAKGSEGALRLEEEARKQRGTPTRPEKVFALLHLLVALAIFGTMKVLDSRVVTIEGAREYVEGGYASSSAPFQSEARELVEMLAHARSSEESLVDTSQLEASFARELEARGDAASELEFWSAGLAGLLSPEGVQRFRDEDEERRLLERSSRVHHVRHACLPILAKLQAGGWSETERATVAERLLVEEGLERDSSLELLCRAELLERLGQGERTSELAPAVERLLRSTWVADPGEPGGSFASSSERADDLRADARQREFGVYEQVIASSTAVRLIDRFGAPAEIDLDRLDRFLRRASRHGSGSPGSSQLLAASTRGHLRALRGEPTSTSSTTFDWLLEKRVYLALMLLTLACVVVTLRAPAVESELA